MTNNNPPNWDKVVELIDGVNEGEPIYDGDPPPNVWDHYAAAALAALLGRGWDVETAMQTAESVADEMMVRRAE